MEATDLVEELVLVVFGAIAMYGTPSTVITGGEDDVEVVLLSAEAEVIRVVVLVMGVVETDIEVDCAVEAAADVD